MTVEDEVATAGWDEAETYVVQDAESGELVERRERSRRRGSRRRGRDERGGVDFASVWVE